MDSMTIYRGMDIGTAKPSIAERGGVPHHLIDVIEPWESASVADYRNRAIEVVGAIEGRGERACSSGALRSISRRCCGASSTGPGPIPDCARLEREAEEHGDAALHARLAALDPTVGGAAPSSRPASARPCPGGDRVDRPAAQRPPGRASPPGAGRGPGVCPGTPASEPLRPDQSSRAGLLRARPGRGSPRPPGRPRPLSPVAAQGIGYSEVIAMLAGEANLDETIDRIQTRSRQFAKRQATWFRRLEEVRPFPLEPGEDPEVVADRLASKIEGGS